MTNLVERRKRIGMSQFLCSQKSGISQMRLSLAETEKSGGQVCSLYRIDFDALRKSWRSDLLALAFRGEYLNGVPISAPVPSAESRSCCSEREAADVKGAVVQILCRRLHEFAIRAGARP